MNEHIIEIDHVSFQYDRQTVLDNITLSIPKGSFLGLVGPNGSGKSTLIKCILGLHKPQQGTIRLFGQDISKFRDWSKIGFVSQKANSFNTGFPASVFEVVATGLTSKIGLFRFMNKNHKQKVLDAIEAVGMSDFVRRNIGELSGGQQQRVFIARALVSEPELLILDEPTVGIDSQNVDNFYTLLEDLHKNHGLTLLLVTHDTGTITEKVTHVACLNKELHFHGETEEYEHLCQHELSAFYGHHVHVLTHDHGGQPV
ncbi:metal ABC transporter ATP-binding protein [Priestia koreensis]|uniref:Zinc ABC transporter ATP-binding protein n=1 Tax=Priestia koreensis TaxID=284581 RepID=A0A0M0KYJ2_9BACI|nr:metal ABC transporter ATP-binding protein [Priestia koreensis]KOO43896.1 zinc ABC transporter ATP-binding protein [Priestia koreensis]